MELHVLGNAELQDKIQNRLTAERAHFILKNHEESLKNPSSDRNKPVTADLQWVWKSYCKRAA